MLNKILATGLLFSALLFGNANAFACQGPHIPSPGEPGRGHCIFNAKPTQLIHLMHLPATIDLHVGDTVVFAADQPRNASNPTVTLDSPGSMRALDVRYFYGATLQQRGDEERIWAAFEATQPGSYTITVTFSAAPGITARTQKITVNIVR